MTWNWSLRTAGSYGVEFMAFGIAASFLNNGTTVKVHIPGSMVVGSWRIVFVLYQEFANLVTSCKSGHKLYPHSWSLLHWTVYMYFGETMQGLIMTVSCVASFWTVLMLHLFACRASGVDWAHTRSWLVESGSNLIWSPYWTGIGLLPPWRSPLPPSSQDPYPSVSRSTVFTQTGEAVTGKATFSTRFIVNEWANVSTLAVKYGDMHAVRRLLPI